MSTENIELTFWESMASVIRSLSSIRLACTHESRAGELNTSLGRNPHPVMPNDTELCLLKSGGMSVGSFALHELIMTHSRDQLAHSKAPLWFCLRTQPKHEYIAAMTLRRQV